LLRRYDKIIVGNSAGALALCRECLLVNRRGRPGTTIIAGFGLVDFSVEVHYTTSEDSELEKLSEQREIYAIPERCALLYDDGRLSSIGKVYLFDHGRKYEASKKMN
jgi:peptidase E